VGGAVRINREILEAYMSRDTVGSGESARGK
jgi:hypothetical protein